jgi:hypothetical protein
MTEEGAINARIAGQKDVQELRNTGNMNIAGLRNEGALAVQGARNEGALAQIGARNEGALERTNVTANAAMARAILSSATDKEIAAMRENGSLSRLLTSIEAEKNNTIYKESQNTWRTRFREGEILDPVENKPPTYPRGNISLDPMKPVVSHGFNAAPVIGGGNGFSAAPGQYEAKPGQYDAPVAGKNPVTGAPAATAGDNTASDNVKPDPTNPEMSLVTFPDGKVRRVPNSEVQSVIQSFDKILIKGTAAGEVGKTPAGQTTGRAAGQVR